jgi:WD40 repeat protein
MMSRTSCRNHVLACLFLWVGIAPLGAEPPADPPARLDCFGDPLPPGALVRMGTIRLRHAQYYGTTAAAAVAPDGRTLVTSDYSRVRFWDLSTGKLRLQFREEGHLGVPEFSPDGTWLAITCGGGIGLWDPATGKRGRLIPFPEAPKKILTLSFSPKGRLLAAGLDDGTVAVWETASGRQVLSRKEHGQAVICVTFGRAGEDTLVTLCRQKKVCHWDLARGTLRKRVDMAIPSWRTLGLSNDGRTLAVVPYSNEPVGLWDTETGKQRCTLGQQPGRYGLAFSADDRILATNWAEFWSDQGTISLWEVATGKLLRHFSLPTLAMDNPQFAPDGRTLVTSCNGPTIYLWDSTTGRQLLQQPAHVGDVPAIAFTPDGRTLVSGSLDGTIRLWDAATGRHQRQLAGHRWAVSGLVLTPDGQAVLSAGPDGCLRLQQLATGKDLCRCLLDGEPEKLPKPMQQIACFALAPDGRTALSFASADRLDRWDLATGRPLATRKAPQQNHYGWAFSPDAEILLSYGSSSPQEGPHSKGRPAAADETSTTTLILEDAKTGRPLVAIPQPDTAMTGCEAFSPDARIIATVTLRQRQEGGRNRVDKHTIHLWDVATGRERLAIVNEGEGWLLQWSRLAFAPDGRTLAGARLDNTLHVWDVATGQELWRRTGEDVPMRCLAFTPDGKGLAVGQADSTILLWDLAPQTWPRVRPARQPDGQTVEVWWRDLAGDDARKAHAAIWGLIGVPDKSLPLLRERLRPAAAVPAERLRQLLADLDHKQFARREGAAAQLQQLGGEAESFLRATLKEPLSEEQRRRAETILAAPPGVGSPEGLRALRATEVLEQIGTPDARELLDPLAKGAETDRLTRTAKAGRERLDRRHRASP